MNIDFCIRIEKQEKLLTVIPKKKQRLGGRNTALAWFSFAINFIYDLSKEIFCIFSENGQFFLFFCCAKHFLCYTIGNRTFEITRCKKCPTQEIIFVRRNFLWLRLVSMVLAESVVCFSVRLWNAAM